MATFLTETYSNIEKRLTDILNTEGGEVSDLPLSLLNSAQDWLWHYRRWEGLIKKATLTLDADYKADMPADFGNGALIRCYSDTDSDNKPDRYLFKEARHKDGYTLRNTFTKAAGHSWEIQFYRSPASSPIIEYQAVLTHFTGTGTEYTYFPADLLLVTAHLIYLEEDEIRDAAGYQMVYNRKQELLRDYEQTHQSQNVEMAMIQLDDEWQEIATEGYDMEGGIESAYLDNYDYSYDR